MIAANNHKGFAVLQILQPCVTFNSLYTHIFYQKNTYELPDDYNKTDKQAAFAKTLEWGEKQIPVGIFYEAQEPTHEEKIPTIAKTALIKQSTKRPDMKKLFRAYE
jgi:2-oxoglutarate ferredoxin oxidoreductase subunit beta